MTRQNTQILMPCYTFLDSNVFSRVKEQGLATLEAIFEVCSHLRLEAESILSQPAFDGVEMRLVDKTRVKPRDPLIRFNEVDRGVRVVSLGVGEANQHGCGCPFLLANHTLIANLLEEGAALLVPGELVDLQPADLAALKKSTYLALLDTGVWPDTKRRIQELSEAIQIPYRVIPVGLDYLSLLLERELAGIRLEAAQVISDQQYIDAEQQLEETRETLQAEITRAQRYLDVAGVMILVTDVDGRVRLINQRGCDILGDVEGQILGVNWFDGYLPEKVRERWRLEYQLALSGAHVYPAHYETPILKRSGELRIIEWQTILVRGEDGKVAEALHSGEDVTDRKEAELKLWYLSTHDALTGLYNRAFFQAEMERLEPGRQFPVSILIGDLDNLKETNDAYGHSAGDELLIRTAQALREAFRSDEIIARIGGDEFGVLLPTVDEETVQMILSRVERIVEMNNQEIAEHTLSISLGAATGVRGCKLGDVMREADLRMYARKAQRKQAGSRGE